MVAPATADRLIDHLNTGVKDYTLHTEYEADWIQARFLIQDLQERGVPVETVETTYGEEIHAFRGDAEEADELYDMLTGPDTYRFLEGTTLEDYW